MGVLPPSIRTHGVGPIIPHRPRKLAYSAHVNQAAGVHQSGHRDPLRTLNHSWLLACHAIGAWRAQPCSSCGGDVPRRMAPGPTAAVIKVRPTSLPPSLFSPSLPLISPSFSLTEAVVCASHASCIHAHPAAHLQDPRRRAAVLFGHVGRALGVGGALEQALSSRSARIQTRSRLHRRRPRTRSAPPLTLHTCHTRPVHSTCSAGARATCR